MSVSTCKERDHLRQVYVGEMTDIKGLNVPMV
jgi:hypothetical protein